MLERALPRGPGAVGRWGPWCPFRRRRARKPGPTPEMRRFQVNWWEVHPKNKRAAGCCNSKLVAGELICGQKGRNSRAMIWAGKSPVKLELGGSFRVLGFPGAPCRFGSSWIARRKGRRPFRFFRDVWRAAGWLCFCLELKYWRARGFCDPGGWGYIYICIYIFMLKAN